jgi:hypothetical protein
MKKIYVYPNISQETWNEYIEGLADLARQKFANLVVHKWLPLHRDDQAWYLTRHDYVKAGTPIVKLTFNGELSKPYNPVAESVLPKELQHALDYLHVFVTSSHNTDWQKKRECWTLVRNAVMQIRKVDPETFVEYAQIVKKLDDGSNLVELTQGGDLSWLHNLGAEKAESPKVKKLERAILNLDLNELGKAVSLLDSDGYNASAYVLALLGEIKQAKK